jgi:hypothetical protein
MSTIIIAQLAAAKRIDPREAARHAASAYLHAVLRCCVTLLPVCEKACGRGPDSPCRSPGDE